MTDHFVDDTVRFRFFRSHVIVAFRITLDHFQRLTCVFCKDLVQFLLGLQDLVRYDADIRSLALGAAGGLVDHDLGVRQSVALALRSAGKKERAHAPMQMVETSHFTYCIVS